MDETAPLDWSMENPLTPGPERPDPALIVGKPHDVLREAWRRREAGASLDAIRRDTGTVGVDDLDNRTLARAVEEQGRRLVQHQEGQKMTDRRRYWGGLPKLPTKAEYEAARREG